MASIKDDILTIGLDEKRTSGSPHAWLHSVIGANLSEPRDIYAPVALNEETGRTRTIVNSLSLMWNDISHLSIQSLQSDQLLLSLWNHSMISDTRLGLFTVDRNFLRCDISEIHWRDHYRISLRSAVHQRNGVHSPLPEIRLCQRTCTSKRLPRVFQVIIAIPWFDGLLIPTLQPLFSGGASSIDPLFVRRLQSATFWNWRFRSILPTTTVLNWCALPRFQSPDLRIPAEWRATCGTVVRSGSAEPSTKAFHLTGVLS
jgi:hypothetical protein